MLLYFFPQRYTHGYVHTSLHMYIYMYTYMCMSACVYVHPQQPERCLRKRQGTKIRGWLMGPYP